MFNLFKKKESPNWAIISETKPFEPAPTKPIPAVQPIVIAPQVKENTPELIQTIPEPSQTTPEHIKNTLQDRAFNEGKEENNIDKHIQTNHKVSLECSDNVVSQHKPTDNKRYPMFKFRVSQNQLDFIKSKPNPSAYVRQLIIQDYNNTKEVLDNNGI